MALHELSEWEDDYVVLSDVEEDGNYASLMTPRASTLRTPLFSGLGKAISNSDDSSINNDHNNSTADESVTPSRHHSQVEDDQDDDDSDLEEIEYGYETDTLLIMPSMLRDYSHHATNYHPELWRSPIPGSSSHQPSAARCRQEDRMLDRQELLKNSIPPTTCGICFDSFTTFELDSQPPLQDPIEDVSSKAQFAFSFAARLARSLTSNFDNGPSQQSIPEASSSSPPGSPSPSSIPTAQSTGDASSTSSCMDQQPPAITPSVSSKDLGITMPCNHGLCLSCLQSFLTNAANSPQARFPTVCPQPGCRTPIPTESAELVLEPEILEIWYRRLAEVHVANKVCCPKPECRSIIDLDDRDGTAVTCPDCRSSYCASCAVPFHQGMTCEQFQAQGGDSEEDRAMHQLVQDRRWRHCPSCRFVIEKQQGCNHMVCHCGQSFCYACGHSWDEIEARCSRDCERNGADGPDDDDVGVECRIM